MKHVFFFTVPFIGLGLLLFGCGFSLTVHKSISTYPSMFGNYRQVWFSFSTSSHFRLNIKDAQWNSKIPALHPRVTRIIKDENGSTPELILKSSDYVDANVHNAPFSKYSYLEETSKVTNLSVVLDNWRSNMAIDLNETLCWNADEILPSSEQFQSQFCNGNEARPNNALKFNAGPVELFLKGGLKNISHPHFNDSTVRHLAIISVPAMPNPTHVAMELFRPLLMFLRHCEFPMVQSQSKQLWVLLVLQYPKNTGTFGDGITNLWSDLVLRKLLKGLMTSNQDRVFVKTSHSGGGLPLNDLELNRIPEELQRLFRPTMVFQSHSYFFTKMNGPWSHLRTGWEFPYRANGGSPWHYTITPAHLGHSDDTARVAIQTIRTGQDSCEPTLKRNMPNQWALFTAMHEGVGALHRASISHLNASGLSKTDIVTRYSDGVPRRYAFGSVEELGEVVRKRLKRENNRRLKLFLYDRKDEKKLNPRDWTNAQDTITALQNRFGEKIEIEYVSKMPMEWSEQTRLFTADVIIAPHGGHMGNLILATNTLVLESQVRTEWYWWLSGVLGHVFVNTRSASFKEGIPVREAEIAKGSHEIDPEVVVWFIERLLGYPIVSQRATPKQTNLTQLMVGNLTVHATSCERMRSHGLVQDVPYTNFITQ